MVICVPLMSILYLYVSEGCSRCSNSSLDALSPKACQNKQNQEADGNVTKALSQKIKQFRNVLFFKLFFKCDLTYVKKYISHINERHDNCCRDLALYKSNRISLKLLL